MPTMLLLAALLITPAAASPAAEETAAVAVPEENVQAAITFLKATRATDAGVLSMEHLLGFMKERRGKDVDPSFWEEAMADIDYDDLAARMAVVYARHLTLEELQAATAFYHSPTGRTLVEKQQILGREASAVGQAWSQENMAQISQRLQEHTDPHRGMAPPSGKTPQAGETPQGGETPQDEGEPDGALQDDAEAGGQERN